MVRSVNLINPSSAPGTLANREGAAGLGVVYPEPGPFFYPPHTLATVAASLRDAGFDVNAFDGVVQSATDDWLQAEAIGVFVSYATLDTDVAYISDLRSHTSAKLVAFGPSARFVHGELLARAPLDAVLVGEAEGYFASALQWLASHHSGFGARLLFPNDVGAGGHDAQGLLEDLDSVPFPAWDLLPHERYPLLTVLSSRGCPDGCTYCPYAVAQGSHFRARSVENVLSELTLLSERFSPSRLVFRDPVFAHDRSRVIRLCSEMIGRNLQLRWECESRPEHFDTELLGLMRRAGCQWVKIGLETTNKDLLVKLGRVTSAREAEAYLRQVAHIVRTCRKMGVQCRLFVMAGLPGQDDADAAETASFVAEVRPDALNVKLCESYPGVACTAEAGPSTQGQLHILDSSKEALRSPRGAVGLPARVRRWLSRQMRSVRHE